MHSSRNDDNRRSPRVRLQNRKVRAVLTGIDFQIDGRRFHGSTKCTTRKEAEKFEAVEHETRQGADQGDEVLPPSAWQIDHVAAPVLE